MTISKILVASATPVAREVEFNIRPAGGNTEEGISSYYVDLTWFLKQVGWEIVPSDHPMAAPTAVCRNGYLYLHPKYLSGYIPLERLESFQVDFSVMKSWKVQNISLGAEMFNISDSELVSAYKRHKKEIFSELKEIFSVPRKDSYLYNIFDDVVVPRIDNYSKRITYSGDVIDLRLAENELATLIEFGEVKVLETKGYTSVLQTRCVAA